MVDLGNYCKLKPRKYAKTGKMIFFNEEKYIVTQVEGLLNIKIIVVNSFL